MTVTTASLPRSPAHSRLRARLVLAGLSACSLAALAWASFVHPLPRLTLDITPALRARIKVSAFTQGVTVADLLRGLLEREFPEHLRENTP